MQKQIEPPRGFYPFAFDEGKYRVGNQHQAAGLFSDELGGGDSVHDGHVHVEDNNVVVARFDHLDCNSAIFGRIRFVAPKFDQRAERFPLIGSIIDNEHAQWLRSRHRQSIPINRTSAHYAYSTPGFPQTRKRGPRFWRDNHATIRIHSR